MRLLSRYLAVSLARPFLILSLCLFTIMMLERALRLIQEMAMLGMPIGHLAPMLASLAPAYLNLAIPAALGSALTLIIAQMATGREIEAMAGNGLSLGRIARPLIAASLLVAMLSLVVGGWGEPFGRHGWRTARVAALNASRIQNYQPGALYRPDAHTLLMADRIAGEGFGGLFLSALDADGQAFAATGRTGRVRVDAQTGAMTVTLNHGLMLADRPTDTRTVQFDALEIVQRLTLDQAVWARGRDHKELTLPELIARRSAQHGTTRDAYDAEILSRLMRALSLPFVPLIILPLILATPPARRGVAIFIAVTLIISTHHGINFAKNLGAVGEARPLAAMAVVATAMLTVTAAIWLAGRGQPGPSRLNMLGQIDVLGNLRLRAGQPHAPALSGHTLASYLAWQAGKYALVVLVSLTLLLQLVDVIDNGERLVRRHADFADFLSYLGLRLPRVLLQAIPVAALAGPLFAFARMRSTEEMTAIQAGGISPFAMLKMLWPVPLLLGLLLLFVSEVAQPPAELRFARWWHATDPNPDSDSDTGPRWFRIGPDLVMAGGAREDGRAMTAVTIFRRTAEGDLLSRTSTPVMHKVAQGWLMAPSRQWTPQGVRTRPETLWPVPLTPDAVIREFRTVPAITAREARRALDANSPATRAPAWYETRIQLALSTPFGPLVMLLLAMPIIFAGQGGGSLVRSMFVAGFVGLSFLVADGLCRVLALTGQIPALAGAWAAPVLFGLVALWLLLGAERITRNP
jgi:LPS export ABC transporter permease LptG